MKRLVGRTAAAIAGGVMVMGATASSWAVDLACRTKEGSLSLEINTETGVYSFPYNINSPIGKSNVRTTISSYYFEIPFSLDSNFRITIDRSSGVADYHLAASRAFPIGVCVAIKPPKL
jgi:hypothetical protein